MLVACFPSQCVSPEQIDLLCAVCHTSRFSSVRANIVGIIGIIGSTMSQLRVRTEGLVVSNFNVYI